MQRHFTDAVVPVLGVQHADKDATRARLERCIADVRPGMRAAVFVHLSACAAGA